MRKNFMHSFLCTVCEGFSGLFCINITRHYGNLKFEVKTVFIQQIEAETSEIHEIIKNHGIPHWFPGYQSSPKIAISQIFVISESVIL